MEVATTSLSKHHEEVCGDSALTLRTPGCTTVILSDGLGSGIKASILSILTTRIAAGLLRRNVGLDQVFETIAKTLPICKVRQLAYSTLSILSVSDRGDAHLIEYENPEILWFHNGKLKPLERRKRMIASKETMESFFKIDEEDTLVLMSDGVINAGVGGLFKLGLGLQGVADHLLEHALLDQTAEKIVDYIINLVDACYLCEPGDDATAVVLHARKPRQVVVLTGPPQHIEDDPAVLKRFLEFPEASRIVCGGATGNLVAKALKTPIRTGLTYEEPDVPPIATIEGIDLVTEGILTLNKCLQKLKDFKQGIALGEGRDGATLLAKQLLAADRLNFLVGLAQNPAHNEFMHSLQLKTRAEAVDALSRVLDSMDKKVSIEYF